ncbi:TSUP family transporter [Pseudochelatococcus sp. G4_1912]|uniref:TSUP family transporter n=1 Tax=Pseudochelatococcus sp. G4_1912 TaxID=3114288 RepID=UPI0039C5C8ED
MGDVELWTVGVLALVGLVAGFIDAIAGGGGLLAVPALLIAGLDPVTALATNKLQSSFGSFSAATAYARARLIDWRAALPMAGAAFIGAIAGAMLVKIMPTYVLAAVMPVLLILVALYFMVSPSISFEGGVARISQRTFTCTIALGVGFYDGCFGPGTGSFFMIGFVTLLGLSIMRATAHTKLLNFASNFGGLLFFTFAGGVNVTIGLSMGIGQYIGAQLGARVAMRNGARIIRPLLVIVCCVMAVRLLLDPANPLRDFIMQGITFITGAL